MICHKSGKKRGGGIWQKCRRPGPLGRGALQSSCQVRCEYVRRLGPLSQELATLNGLFATLVGLARLECV